MSACKHPPERQFWWWARDVEGKDVLCGGCCACGAVLRGGADSEAQAEGSEDDGG